MTATDWCHFTWSVNYPAETRRVFDLSKRRHQESHFSYLHLTKREGDKVGARVLSSRSAGKGKWRLDLCSQGGGPEALLALSRKKETYESVVAAEANQLVFWGPEDVEQKGDGLRLKPGALLSIVPRET